MSKDKTSKVKSSDQKAAHTLFLGSKKALFGGLLAAVVALSGQWLVGQVYSGYQARQLLEAVALSSLYLGSAVVTASATIIALMLTMISLTKQTEGEFEAVFLSEFSESGFFQQLH